jgi:hypothetical protein
MLLSLPYQTKQGSEQGTGIQHHHQGYHLERQKAARDIVGLLVAVEAESSPMSDSTPVNRAARADDGSASHSAPASVSDKHRLCLSQSRARVWRLSESHQASPRLTNCRIFSGSANVGLLGRGVFRSASEELNLPSAPIEEIHVDLMAEPIVARHGLCRANMRRKYSQGSTWHRSL